MCLDIQIVHAKTHAESNPKPSQRVLELSASPVRSHYCLITVRQSHVNYDPDAHIIEINDCSQFSTIGDMYLTCRLYIEEHGMVSELDDRSIIRLKGLGLGHNYRLDNYVNKIHL